MIKKGASAGAGAAAAAGASPKAGGASGRGSGSGRPPRGDKQYGGSDDGMYYNPFAALLKK